MEKKFIVFYCTPVEESEDKTFTSLEFAKRYIELETAGCTELDPRDTDNGNNHFWFDVYEDWAVSDDGMELNNPVYTSKKYYNYLP